MCGVRADALVVEGGCHARRVDGRTGGGEQPVSLKQVALAGGMIAAQPRERRPLLVHEWGETASVHHFD